MDNVKKKVVYIKSLKELKEIAKCIKSTKLIHTYELTVHNFQSHHCDNNSLDNDDDDNICYYIPLKHLFGNHYGCAIVSFIHQRENLLLQINLLQSFNITNDMDEWRNFTYSQVGNSFSKNFIADFTCKDAPDYVIVYSEHSTPPTLLRVLDHVKEKSTFKYIQFGLFSVVSIVCWLYGFYMYLDCQYSSIISDQCNSTKQNFSEVILPEQ